MKNFIRFAIFLLISVAILTNSFNSFAQEEKGEGDNGGFILYPALHEPTESKGSYKLTIKNQEKLTVDAIISPWLFEFDQDKLRPVAKAQVTNFDLSYITPSEKEIKLKTNEEKTIEIKYDLGSFEGNYIPGVIAQISSEGKFSISASIGSAILYRGKPEEESLELTILSKPKITLGRNIKIEYQITNTGNYIVEPSGEIQVQRNEKINVKNIQITSKIRKNLLKNHAVSDTFNFQIPKKDKFWKEIGKYDFKLNVNSSSGKNYQTVGSIYYINPVLLLIAGVSLIAIVSIFYSIKKIKR